MSDDSSLPRVEVTVAAPVEAVWDALRDKDKIRHWHGWDYEGLDGEIDLVFFTETVEDSDARTLRLHGGDLIRLDPSDGGTRITLTRAPRGDNPDWDAYYGEITEGWITFLNQLRFAVERKPDVVRRTVFLAGGNEGKRDLIASLGLVDGPAGTPFQAHLVGEDVKGEVFFRSDNQLGVTVDVWGGGLLIVSSVDPSELRPKGAAMAVLSTYGLADAELDSVNQRWTSWWAPRFPGGDVMA